MPMSSSEKLLKVLEKLCLDGPAKAVSLSHELHLNKSSVHRFLNTLISLGYINQNPETGFYSAGLKVYEMGVQVKGRLGIAKIAAPLLRRLQVEVNEAVNLGVLHNNEMLTIERFTPDDENIKIVVKTKLPAYCTALGKVLLAGLDQRSFERYLTETKFNAFTSRTVTDPAVLRRMISEVRDLGYAIDDRELDNNIRSVATPLHDDSGMVVAGISVSAAVTRLDEERLDAAKQMLLQATEDIELALGHKS